MTAPQPPKKKVPMQHGVGNMEAAPPKMKRVQGVGRNSSRVYCDVCGQKKKGGQCPRGHQA